MSFNSWVNDMLMNKDPDDIFYTGMPDNPEPYYEYSRLSEDFKNDKLPDVVREELELHWKLMGDDDDDDEQAFDMVEKLTEELVDKEQRIMELEKQLKKTEEEKVKYYIEKLTLQRVSQFYNGLHPDGVSFVDAMDWLDEHLDCYGNDKYKMFVDALDYICGIQEHQLFDEDEIRKIYEDLYNEGEITGDKLDLIEDIIECLEDYDQYYSYFELNVNKPCDGREDGIRVWFNNMV